jgi:hypothetical protein
LDARCNEKRPQSRNREAWLGLLAKTKDNKDKKGKNREQRFEDPMRRNDLMEAVENECFKRQW